MSRLRPARGPAVTNTIRDTMITGGVLQAQVVNVIEEPLPRVPVPAQLRPPVAGFTGRGRELDDVLAVLDPEAGDGPGACVIAGLPGAGKTELASRAGMTAATRGWFSGGVISIDMHGYDDVTTAAEQAIDLALRALGTDGDDIPPSLEHRVGLYRSTMAAASGPVLVVADNAAFPEQVEPLILPGTRHRVIVTSRHTLPQLHTRLIELPDLAEDEAVELLDTSVRLARPGDGRISADRDAARQVAKLCGCLPLALQIAAALLRRDPTKSVAALAADLTDESGRLHRLDDQRQAVIPVFDLSYRRLAPADARLFRLLAVNPGPDFTTRAASAATGLAEDEAREILSGLAEAHIVEQGVVPDRWRMHDLIRVYAQQRADENTHVDQRDAALERLLYAYRDDASEAWKWLTGQDELDDRFPDRAGALTWLEYERPTLVAATLTAVDAWPVICQDLAWAMVPFLQARFYLDDMLAVTEAGLEAAHRRQDFPLEALLLLSRCGSLRAARRFSEAFSACRRALDISENTGDQDVLAQGLVALAAILAETRQFEEALDVCDRAVSIAWEQEDQFNEALALNNQALALIGLHRVAEALPLARRAAGILREKDHLGTAALALNNLAVSLFSLRQSAEAASILHDAVTYARESGNLDGQALSLCNLALALADSGTQPEAQAAAEESVKICRQTGNRHREGEALLALVRVLNDRRDDEAVAAAHAAAEIFRETADLQLEGAALRGMGIARWHQERLEEAAVLLTDAAAHCRAADDDLGEGLALDDLADVYHAQRRPRLAAVGYLQAAALLWQAREERSAARSRDRLDAILRKLRDWPPAEILRATDGYPPDRITMTDLGYALSASGRPGEAIAMHREAVTLSQADHDPAAETLALSALATSLLEVSRPDEAIETARRALAVAQAAGLRREEISVWRSLGHVLGAAGHDEEAADAWRACVTACEGGDAYRLARALTGWGLALLSDPVSDEMIAVLTRAADLSHQARSDTEARAKGALAYCMMMQDRLDEAISLAWQARNLFLDEGHMRGQISASSIWWRAGYLRLRKRLRWHLRRPPRRTSPDCNRRD